MSDDVKKVAIPSLAGVLIAAWWFGVEPTIFNTILGLFAASIGFPLIGSVATAVGIKR